MLLQNNDQPMTPRPRMQFITADGECPFLLGTVLIRERGRSILNIIVWSTSAFGATAEAQVRSPRSPRSRMAQSPKRIYRWIIRHRIGSSQRTVRRLLEEIVRSQHHRSLARLALRRTYATLTPQS